MSPSRPPLLAALLALLAPAAAWGDPPASLDQTMERYFHGERDEGYAWMAAGDASLVAGGALLAQGSGIARGLSYPLLAVGAIQLVAGLSSLARSDGRLDDLRRRSALDPRAVREGEGKRIERLNFLFKVIRYTEYSLLGLGAVGAAVGAGIREDQLLGAGLGLAEEAALMLTLDHFAEQRAHRYGAGLGRLAVAIEPGPEGTALLLGFGRRF